MRRKNRLALYVGVVVSALFLWLALRGANLSMIVQALWNVHVGFAPCFLAALFGTYWLKAKRWQIMLTPLQRIPTRDIFPAVMVGYASSMLLPMQLGEVVRAVVAGGQLRLRVSSLLTSIVVERMFDLLMVPLLLAVALGLGSNLSQEYVVAGYIAGGISFGVLTGAAAYMVWAPQFLSAARAGTAYLPSAIQGRILVQLELGALGLQSLRSPGLLTAIGATTLLQWTLMSVCCYISLLAAGISGPFPAALVVLAATNIAVALPTSPGFIGSVQLAYAFALHPYGVSSEDALAASIFFQVLVNLSAFLTGMYYVRRLGYSMRGLRSRAEQVEADPPSS
jgi:uncharacterized membrane protein YbhN (UPF0104 family)